jgi:thioredoxin 1
VKNMNQHTMPPIAKAMIVVAVIVGVSAVLMVKSLRTTNNSVSEATSATDGAALPKIVCLGAGKCIPCKAMEPVREALRREYAGRMIVEFHDVWQNPDVGRRSGISLIPTTIFYDATGKELARAEGFMSKQDILARFQRLGVSL